MNTSKLTRWQSTSHTITCAVATDKFSKYILYNHVTAIDTFKLTSWLNTSYIITCVVAINTFKLTSWLNTSCIITCVVAINTFKLTSWLNTFSYYHPWQRTDQWNTTKLHGWVCHNLFIDLAVWNNTSNHIIHSPTAWVQRPATRHPELLQQPHHTQPHSLSPTTSNPASWTITAATSHTAPQLESNNQQPGILNYYSSHITHSPTAWLHSLSPLKLSPCSLKVD